MESYFFFPPLSRCPCFPQRSKCRCYTAQKGSLLSRVDDRDPLTLVWVIKELQEWAPALYHWVISFAGTQRILQKQHVSADSLSIIWPSAAQTPATLHWTFLDVFFNPTSPCNSCLSAGKAESYMFCCKESGFIPYFYCLYLCGKKKKHLKLQEYQEYCHLVHQKEITCFYLELKHG